MIYFIRGEQSKLIKIGVASDVTRRLGELRTGSSERLVLLATMPGDAETERELHKALAEARVRGEWFQPRHELLALIGRLRRNQPPNEPEDSPEPVHHPALVRHAKRFRQRREDFAHAITLLADARGMSPEEWVWSYAMPRVIEIAEAELATLDGSPSDAVA